MSERPARRRAPRRTRTRQDESARHAACALGARRARAPRLGTPEGTRGLDTNVRKNTTGRTSTRRMDSTKHERLLRAFLVVAQLVRVVSSWDASFTTSHVGRGVLRPTLARR